MKLPDYLSEFVLEQDYSQYTPIDHASWRYILRVSQSFFSKVAHQKYLDGLKETGISLDHIPRIHEMNACLEKFGWQAVAVSGFIPPAVFMEFISLGILPIACDMRKLEHLAYTPAPDIVHEAAGHAPIIADPDYRNYLRSYGEICRKAIFSKRDIEIYEAVRSLSDIKEDPDSSAETIARAENRLASVVADVTYTSENVHLARMAWWTVEYGLIGKMENPKIYGAGLLSSVGESYHCFSDRVKKVPLTLDCIHQSYDITKPQPQLFVTPDFSTVGRVLSEYSKTMAFQKGGLEGLAKARSAETTTTTVLDSGLQISGTLVDLFSSSDGKPTFLKYTGPTQLAFHEKEIQNQGATYHKEGFSCPIGALENTKKSAADLSLDELRSFGFDIEKKTKGKLRFESGIELEGILTSTVREKESFLILTFKDCTVRQGLRVLFNPAWGTFDLACGNRVISVFGGAADRKKYLEDTGGFGQKPKKQKTNLSPENRELNELYQKVRTIRNEGASTKARSALEEVSKALEKNYLNDWLLRLELHELERSWNLNSSWAGDNLRRLQELTDENEEFEELIKRGLKLIP